MTEEERKAIITNVMAKDKARKQIRKNPMGAVSHNNVGISSSPTFINKVRVRK